MFCSYLLPGTISAALKMMLGPVCDLWTVLRFLPQWSQSMLSRWLSISWRLRKWFPQLSTDSWAGVWGFTGHTTTCFCLNYLHCRLSGGHIGGNVRPYGISVRRMRCQSDDKVHLSLDTETTLVLKNAKYSMMKRCTLEGTCVVHYFSFRWLQKGATL